MGTPEFLEDLFTGPFGFLAAALWGAVWGSFYNVLIVRLPAGESLVRPASHCRSCGQPVPWYDNIPLASYCLLRGRCRRCGARFSARYLLVEVLVLGLALLLYARQMGADPLAASLGLKLARFVITSLFAGLLVAIAFIDFDTLRIPDAITYPAIPVAMVLSVFMGTAHLWDGPVGGVAGYLVVRGLADGYRLLTRRMGMGYGDAKLLALIGALLGWQVLLPVLFLAALQGSVIGISLLVIVRRLRRGARGSEEAAGTPATGAPGIESEARGRGEVADDGTPEGGPRDDDPDDDAEDDPSSLRYARLPFGPFLSLAAIEVLFLREELSAFFPYLFD